MRIKPLDSLNDYQLTLLIRCRLSNREVKIDRVKAEIDLIFTGREARGAEGLHRCEKLCPILGRLSISMSIRTLKWPKRRRLQRAEAPP